MSRILAIEPDAARASTLEQLIRERVGSHVIMTASADQAIAALAEQMPDLILTSALIRPTDDLHLVEHLKQRADLRELPMLTVPPIVDPDQASQPKRRGLKSFFRRQLSAPWLAYDPELVGERIREALECAREARITSRIRAQSRPHIAPTETLSLDDEKVRARCGLGDKRQRAHRWAIPDVPWVSTITVPWGLEARLLNISSTGMLIESGTRFVTGAMTLFELLGPNRNRVVAARVVRSLVAAVDRCGVTYQTAAVFDATLDSLPSRPPSLDVGARTRTQAEIADRVKSAVRRGAAPAEARAEFERGIEELVRAREIRLRDVLVVRDDGSDSVYFTVSSSPQSRTILQATFEPNYRPSAEEFAVLRSAASAAAEILDLMHAPRRSAASAA